MKKNLNLKSVNFDCLLLYFLHLDTLYNVMMATKPVEGHLTKARVVH